MSDIKFNVTKAVDQIAARMKSSDETYLEDDPIELMLDTLYKDFRIRYPEQCQDYVRLSAYNN